MIWRPRWPGKPKEGDDAADKASRRRRLIWKILRHGLAAALGIVFGFAIFDRVLMPLVVRQGQEVVVPSVVLMNEDEADSVLASFDLGFLVVATRDDPDIAPGRIMEQVPGAGMSVKRGRTVRALVSSGVEATRIPEIRGQPISHARLMLTREGIRLGKITYVVSDEVADHTVLAAHPAPGAPVAENAEVDLLVSQGHPPKAYLMPDLRGRAAPGARRDLEAAGFRVTVRPFPGEPAGSEEIVEQTPPPGHKLEEGGTVELLTGIPRRRWEESR